MIVFPAHPSSIEEVSWNLEGRPRVLILAASMELTATIVRLGRALPSWNSKFDNVIFWLLCDSTVFGYSNGNVLFLSDNHSSFCFIENTFSWLKSTFYYDSWFSCIVETISSWACLKFHNSCMRKSICPKRCGNQNWLLIWAFVVRENFRCLKPRTELGCRPITRCYLVIWLKALTTNAAYWVGDFYTSRTTNSTVCIWFRFMLCLFCVTGLLPYI